MDRETEDLLDQYQVQLRACRAFGRPPESDPELRRLELQIQANLEDQQRGMRFVKSFLVYLIVALSIAGVIWTVTTLSDLLRSVGL